MWWSELVIRWFKSYFTRSQVVKIGNALSECKAIGQGTILWTLVFIFPLPYTKRHEKRLSHTITQHRFCVSSFPRGVRCLGQCGLFPMVRHTVSSYFTLVRDLNLETLILTNHSISRFRPMGEKKIIAIKKSSLRPTSQCHVTNCRLAVVVTATVVVTAMVAVKATDVVTYGKSSWMVPARHKQNVAIM